MRCESSFRSDGRGGFFATGAPQSSGQVGDFDALHFGVEIDAFLRNEDGFLAARAVLKEVLRQVFGRNGADRSPSLPNAELDSPVR